ncbi:MAG: hypothetical protein E7399_09470 [Ruminococcaceae bacterium]|nr:hypothetical protein [Oscillospiraceae bacterium]
MKKILKTFILIVILAATFLPSSAYAEAKRGTYKNFIYLQDNNEIVIVGWNGSSKEVTIPEKINGKLVVEIAGQAFAECTSLETVTIPKSVTKIGDFAFYGCTSLQSVTIPNGVEQIGRAAFCECSALESIKIPDSVSVIMEGAFLECMSLKEISLPDSVSSIGFYVFAETAYYHNQSNWSDGVLYIGNHLLNASADITECEIRQGTKTIADDAFAGCIQLETVIIPDSVTSIGREAFQRCDSLTTVLIPDSVTTIGVGAFCDCSHLTDVILSANLTELGTNLFNGCSELKRVVMYDSVKKIGDHVFVNCSELCCINYIGAEESWEAIEFESEAYGVEADEISVRLIDDSAILLTIGKKEAIISGKVVQNDVAPMIVNDRTMLPIRFVAEGLGAEVLWSSSEPNQVYLKKEGLEIVITIGAKTAMVNQQEISLDSPAFIKQNRTYLPIRFVAEYLGAEVEWDENTESVMITK